MTMWKRWIQGGVLCGLVLGGLGACSLVEHPAISQVAFDDHAAQAAWHDKEAARLRTAAKDELAMAEAYRQNPAIISPRGGVIRKTGMIQHRENLAGLYTRAAEEAEAIAKNHRDMLE